MPRRVKLKLYTPFLAKENSYEQVSIHSDIADSSRGSATSLWIEIGRAGPGEVRSGIRAGLSGSGGLSSHLDLPTKIVLELQKGEVDWNSRFWA